jgi:hypothetical protein
MRRLQIQPPNPGAQLLLASFHLDHRARLRQDPQETSAASASQWVVLEKRMVQSGMESGSRALGELPDHRGSAEGFGCKDEERPGGM